MMNQKKILVTLVSMIVLITIAGAIFFLNSPQSKEKIGNEHPTEKHSGKHDEDDDHDEKKVIKLSDDQIKRFDFQSITLNKSHFQHRITFPGQIALNENTITHVVPSVPGIVKEVFKGLGETVKPGETLATLQSREMAEAKSFYISAHKNLELQKDLFEREEKLWKKKIQAEVQLIQARNSYENAKINLDQAKQKLLALGVTEEQIQKLPTEKSALNIYTIDSPVDGKIIERHITLGELISNDKQVFVIANLDTVWINLAIPAEELPKIKKGQKADVFAHQGNLVCSGLIMYVSPVINEESRTGRAVIQIDNPQHALHPGDFIKAQVVADENSALLSLPNSAIQRIDGKNAVFVKVNGNSFEIKFIETKGSGNSEFVEIIDGLNEGDEVVIKNSFLLKAELGKSEAEHSH
jgi:cobalt-zinc-cadmium efflux system membrane fusion protein